MNQADQLQPLCQFLYSEAARLNLTPDVVLKYLAKYTGLTIIRRSKRSVFLRVTDKTKPPEGFLGQQPGEIPLKAWLMDAAEREQTSTASGAVRNSASLFFNLRRVVASI